MQFKINLVLLAFFATMSGFCFGQPDTIYYFDCTDSIPAGWQPHDSTGNNFIWKHTTVGIESAKVNVIKE